MQCWIWVEGVCIENIIQLSWFGSYENCGYSHRALRVKSWNLKLVSFLLASFCSMTSFMLKTVLFKMCLAPKSSGEQNVVWKVLLYFHLTLINLKENTNYMLISACPLTLWNIEAWIYKNIKDRKNYRMVVPMMLFLKIIITLDTYIHMLSSKCLANIN